MSSGRKRTVKISHSKFYELLNEAAKSSDILSDGEWVTEVEELYTIGDVTLHIADNEHS